MVMPDHARKCQGRTPWSAGIGFCGMPDRLVFLQIGLGVKTDNNALPLSP
jgi:hypothetical protein